MIDPTTLTDEDIVEYQRQIDSYYHKRHVMIGIAVPMLILAIPSIVLGMTFMIIGGSSRLASLFAVGMILVWIGPFLLTASIILLILKSAIFNGKISNRKQLIKEATMYRSLKK